MAAKSCAHPPGHPVTVPNPQQSKLQACGQQPPLPSASLTSSSPLQPTPDSPYRHQFHIRRKGLKWNNEDTQTLSRTSTTGSRHSSLPFTSSLPQGSNGSKLSASSPSSNSLESEHQREIGLGWEEVREDCYLVEYSSHQAGVASSQLIKHSQLCEQASCLRDRSMDWTRLLELVPQPLTRGRSQGLPSLTLSSGGWQRMDMRGLMFPALTFQTLWTPEFNKSTWWFLQQSSGNRQSG
jgi:hypothetical protein